MNAVGCDENWPSGFTPKIQEQLILEQTRYAYIDMIGYVMNILYIYSIYIYMYTV